MVQSHLLFINKFVLLWVGHQYPNSSLSKISRFCREKVLLKDHIYKPELLLIFKKLWGSWDSKTFLKSWLKSTVTLPIEVWVHLLWLKRSQMTLVLLLRVFWLFLIFNFWSYAIFSYHKRYLHQIEKNS